MKIKNAAKKIGSAIYEMGQKSAEKPRILGSSQKQIIFLVLIIIFSFWVGYKLLSYSKARGTSYASSRYRAKDSSSISLRRIVRA